MLSVKNQNLYFRTDFRYIPIHTSSKRNNALNDLTIMKLTVARFADARGKLQSRRYRNVSTVPLATVRGSVGIRVTHFVDYYRNRCSK
jgi:hypothetical protein